MRGTGGAWIDREGLFGVKGVTAAVSILGGNVAQSWMQPSGKP
jgi:hypothetical protein